MPSRNTDPQEQAPQRAAPAGAQPARPAPVLPAPVLPAVSSLPSARLETIELPLPVVSAIFELFALFAPNLIFSLDLRTLYHIRASIEVLLHPAAPPDRKIPARLVPMATYFLETLDEFLSQERDQPR